MRKGWLRIVGAVAAAAVVFGVLAAPMPADAVPDGPAPGTQAWFQREIKNWGDAYGRYNDQQRTPGFFAAVSQEVGRLQQFWSKEDAEQFAGRPRITLTRFLLSSLFIGDPWRNETKWDGTHERLYFLNRWGAKLTADLWGPADLFETDERRPTIVITTGSIQGNSRMYWWAAQELARRGYVVLSYDVQGQGESETFGHKPDGSFWCGVDPAEQATLPPFLRETGNCPGFPFQQPANFGWGAINAQDFVVSTPDAPYQLWRDGTGTSPFNPWWDKIDPDRLGIAGHSLGAGAVSFVQANPQLVRTPAKAVVAWDSLGSCSARSTTSDTCPPEFVNTPLVPALNLTNDYFIPLAPLSPRSVADPKAKLRSFGAWRDEGLDVMSIAIRAGTHLEYTAIPGVTPFFPATLFGQDIALHYTMAWFDRYVAGDTSAETLERLTTRQVTFMHRTPIGDVYPTPITLDVANFTSLYSDSGISIAGPGGACNLDWGVNDEPC